MKRAKKFIGSIVKVKNFGDNSTDYIGITRNYNDFKNKTEYYYQSIEVFDSNVILYNCDIRNAGGQLSTLCSIRNMWNNSEFSFRDFYTKEQIKILLENDYLVAAQGLGEMTIEDLKLLKSNTKYDWKFDDKNFQFSLINNGVTTC